MDLKEMVLSAIADLEAVEKIDDAQQKNAGEGTEGVESNTEDVVKESMPAQNQILDVDPVKQSDEVEFLGSMKDRLLVIFEGLQSPSNQTSEAKIDLVLNFLEYLLAVVEERIEAKEKGV